MTTSHNPEWHPWLKLFTILAIFPGSVLWFLIGMEGVKSDFDICFGLVMPVGMILVAIRTLSVTDFFRRWDNGLSQRDRSIGMIAIILGAMIAIALFFASPFFRLITDWIGGGKRS